MRYAHWTSTPSSMALSGYEVGQTIMARGELHYAALSDGLDERVRTLQAALAVRASSYEPPTSHRLWHTTSSPTAAVTCTNVSGLTRQASVPGLGRVQPQ